MTTTKRRSVKGGAGEAVDAHERGKGYLSPGEVEKLLKAAKDGRHGDRDHALLLLMYRHGLRVSEAINIKLSLESTRYYLAHAKQFDFRQRGYLWMYDEELWTEARTFLPVVRSFGLPVEELTASEVQKKFAVLDDVSDLAGATFTPFDGRLSPHRLRTHYINHAQAGGVELLSGWQVVGIEGEKSPYRVTMRRVSPRSIKRALTDGVATSNKPPKEPADELVVSCDRIINAAGPWAP